MRKKKKNKKMKLGGNIGYNGGMSFGFFILGVLMMVAGISMVWKTAWWDNNWGDIGAAFGLKGSGLEHWKLIGVIMMFLGFLLAFGLFELFFNITVGRLLPTGL